MIPFVCFGSGHDFQDSSTILDRVVTMNDFFPLNKIFIEKTHLPFEPVSMFFRYKDWSTEEMTKIMTDVADEAIKYHFR
jgi:type II restriction enzyme